MNDLTIQYRPPSELIPYINNAKVHSDTQIAMIAASIKEFGFNAPILTDGENGIIAGHGRTDAAIKLGMALVPTVDLSHLSEAQRKAYILADNRLGEVGVEWDLDLVSNELQELQDMDFDIDLTGFGDGDVLVDIEEGLTDEDEVPEVAEDAITKLGDIWLCGNHRVMCGDSTSVDSVNALLEGKKAGMVHTDPPYGISYQSNTRKEKFDVLKNDDVFLDIAPIIEACSSGWVFVWTSWKVLPKWTDMFRAFGYPTNQIIWAKGGGGIGDLKKTFSSDYETALVWHRGAEIKGKRIGSVWKVNKDSASKYVHPTQKPVALPEEAISKTTNPGDMVLDIFGGSGSTLIACEKIGRKGRVMELDEKYCDVIVKRWQDYTGKSATLESTGEAFNTIVEQNNDSR